MSINDRLKIFYDWYIEGKKINQKEFSKVVDIGYTQLNLILTGKNNAGLSIIQKFLDGFKELNANWLITGNGEMLKNDNPNDNSNDNPNTHIKENADNFRVLYDTENKTNNVAESQMTLRRLKTDYFNLDRQEIPLYEIEAAAGLSTVFSSQNLQVPIDFISVPNAPKCDGALYIRGDSMYPILKAGDIACYKVIQDKNNVRFGEIYILDIDDGDDQYLTVKYIQKSDINDEYFKLVSQNVSHNPKEEKRSNIRMMAIVKLWIRYNTIS